MDNKQKFEREAGNYLTMAQLEAVMSVHNALYEVQLAGVAARAIAGATATDIATDLLIDKIPEVINTGSNITGNENSNTEGDSNNQTDAGLSESIVEAINNLSDEEFNYLLENSTNEEIEILTEAILWNGLKALGKGLMTVGKNVKHGVSGKYAADFAKLSKKRDALKTAYQNAPTGSQTKIAKDLAGVEDKMQKLQVKFADNRMRGPFGGAASEKRLAKNAEQVEKAAKKYGDAAYGINGSYTGKISGLDKDILKAEKQIDSAIRRNAKDIKTYNKINGEKINADEQLTMLQEKRGNAERQLLPKEKIAEIDADIEKQKAIIAEKNIHLRNLEDGINARNAQIASNREHISILKNQQRENASAFGFGETPNWTFGTQSQKAGFGGLGGAGAGFAGQAGAGAFGGASTHTGAFGEHGFHGFNRTAGAGRYGANGYGFNPYGSAGAQFAENVAEGLGTFNKLLKRAVKTKGIISASTFVVPGIAAIGIGGLALYGLERNFKPAAAKAGLTDTSKASFWNCIKTAGASMAAGYIGYKGMEIAGVDSTIAKVAVSVIASVVAGYLVNELGSTKEEANEILNTANSLDMNGNFDAEKKMLSQLNIDEVGRALQEYAEREERSSKLF